MRTGKSKNVSREDLDLVVRMVKQCLREIAKKEYEIGNMRCLRPVTYKELRENCMVYVKNIINQRSNFQREGIFDGERNKITINIEELAFARRVIQMGKPYQGNFKEYASFNKDPVIGGFSTTNPEIFILAIVAHEVAHYIQKVYGKHTSYLKNTYEKTHGDGFKAVYRSLRRSIVNPLAKETA